MTFGQSNGIRVRMLGPASSLGASGGKLSHVELSALDWKGAVSPYSQEVTVEGVSVNSQVDLIATAEQLEEMQNTVTQFVAENDGGTVTVYAIGDKPTEDLAFLCVLTEVSV